MRPKSLCFFNTNRAWGGGEKWHSEHALLCRDRGYKVCVVAGEGGALANRLAGEPGITLLTLPVGNLSFLNPLKLARVRRFYLEQAVDAVVLCLPADMKLGGLAARLAGVRDIIYRRGIAVPVRNTALNRLLYGRVLTKLIVNSWETRRCVLAHNQSLMPHRRIHLVHFGTDVASFDSLPVRPLVERRPGEVLIGNAARLTLQKGQRHLIDAAALLRGQGMPFRVLIAGAGELEAELKEHARARGVADCVEFLGFVEDIKSFYHSIDIFALPSLWEGFGQAQAEAMLMNLPIVAWRVSSIPEVVLDGETGRLCEPCDVDCFASALAELMEDQALRRRLGERGRARVIEQFSMARTFADFERCLEA